MASTVYSRYAYDCYHIVGAVADHFALIITQADEIARLTRLGEELVKTFTKIEEAQGEAQLRYFNEDARFKGMGELVAAATAKIAEDEATGERNRAINVTSQ